MKRYLIIALTSLMILLQVNSESKLNEVPMNPPDWWNELNNNEQWLYFREMSLEYKKLYNIAITDQKSDKALIKDLKATKNQLKKVKPYYPKFGLSFAVNGSITYYQKLEYDLYLRADFLIFLLRGRFFLSPGLNVKINDIGGGINLGLGVTF